MGIYPHASINFITTIYFKKKYKDSHESYHNILSQFSFICICRTARAEEGTNIYQELNGNYTQNSTYLGRNDNVSRLKLCGWEQRFFFFFWKIEQIKNVEKTSATNWIYNDNLGTMSFI